MHFDIYNNMEFRKWYEVFDTPTETQNVVWYNDDTEQVIHGPICGHNLVARFNLAKDSYWVRIEEIDTDSVSISFGTRRTGVFMTNTSTPFTTLTQVLGVLGQFLQVCPQVRFTFTGYSNARNRVFTRLIAKFLPNYTQTEDGFYAKSNA